MICTHSIDSCVCRATHNIEIPDVVVHMYPEIYSFVYIS